MRYKIIKFLSLFVLVLIISQTEAQFVPCERTYTVHFSPLLKKLSSLTDFNGNLFLGDDAKILPLVGTSFGPNGQELVKHNGKLFIFLSQTGFIFQMQEPVGDSVVFRKIDNTININYNIDCTTFIYKDQLYNYGGYGFWTKTGNVRKYNTVDQEWDIQPTNKEVIPGGYEWYSPKEGRLYVPFQKIEKSNLKDEAYKKGVYDYGSYYLDINTLDWIKIGKVSSELMKLINSKSNFINYPHTDGRIFIMNEDAYFLDYIHNKIYKSKRADINQFFSRNAQDLTVFYYKGYFYKYISSNQTFKIWKLNLNDFQELSFPIWGSDYKNVIIIMSLCLVTILIILFAWFFNRSVRRKIEKAQLKALKSKTLNQAFTETEMGLIQLLIDAHGSKHNVEIADINHVLGIKDKNIGLQKKVRSDIINAINDKYLFITQGEHNLIGSIRKEDDKRFFEYFIVASEVKTLQKIIEKN